MDDTSPVFNLKREIGRRRIPGTHKVEIVYAVPDPSNPMIETYVREIMLEKEESSGNK